MLIVFVVGGRRLAGRSAWLALMAVAVALGLAMVGAVAVRYPAAPVVPPISSTSGSQPAAVSAAWQPSFDRLAAATDLRSGTVGLIFPRVAQPEHISQTYDTLTDQAHSGYLQVLLTTGLLGLGSYLLVQDYFLFGVVGTAYRAALAVDPSSQEANERFAQLTAKGGAGNKTTGDDATGNQSN